MFACLCIRTLDTSHDYVLTRVRENTKVGNIFHPPLMINKSTAVQLEAFMQKSASLLEKQRRVTHPPPLMWSNRPCTFTSLIIWPTRASLQPSTLVAHLINKYI